MVGSDGEQTTNGEPLILISPLALSQTPAFGQNLGHISPQTSVEMAPDSIILKADDVSVCLRHVGCFPSMNDTNCCRFVVLGPNASQTQCFYKIEKYQLRNCSKERVEEEKGQ